MYMSGKFDIFGGRRTRRRRRKRRRTKKKRRKRRTKKRRRKRRRTRKKKGGMGWLKQLAGVALAVPVLISGALASSESITDGSLQKMINLKAEKGDCRGLTTLKRNILKSVHPDRTTQHGISIRRATELSSQANNMFDEAQKGLTCSYRTKDHSVKTSTYNWEFKHEETTGNKNKWSKNIANPEKARKQLKKFFANNKIRQPGTVKQNEYSLLMKFRNNERKLLKKFKKVYGEEVNDKQINRLVDILFKGIPEEGRPYEKPKKSYRDSFNSWYDSLKNLPKNIFERANNASKMAIFKGFAIAMTGYLIRRGMKREEALNKAYEILDEGNNGHPDTVSDFYNWQERMYYFYVDMGVFDEGSVVSNIIPPNILQAWIDFAYPHTYEEKREEDEESIRKVFKKQLEAITVATPTYNPDVAELEEFEEKYIKNTPWRKFISKQGDTGWEHDNGNIVWEMPHEYANWLENRAMEEEQRKREVWARKGNDLDLKIERLDKMIEDERNSTFAQMGNFVNNMKEIISDNAHYFWHNNYIRSFFLSEEDRYGHNLRYNNWLRDTLYTYPPYHNFSDAQVDEWKRCLNELEDWGWMKCDSGWGLWYMRMGLRAEGQDINEEDLFVY